MKRSYKVKDKEEQEQTEKQYFYGYKAHASPNAHSGMITSLCHSSGNGPDNEHFCRLVEANLARGLPVAGYAAHRAYDDGELHALLEANELQDALKLNRYRTTKKDPNKQVWVELQESQFYQRGLKERYKIQRKFGQAKQGHGLRRCRYVGLVRHATQSFLTAMALKLRPLVLVLTGVLFKGRARALAQSQGRGAPGERRGTLGAALRRYTGRSRPCGSLCTGPPQAFTDPQSVHSLSLETVPFIESPPFRQPPCALYAVAVC